MELTKEQKVIQAVVNKAWEDPSFKAELIAAPAQAIQKATGESIILPEGVRLVVHDQSDPTAAYFNIPAKPNYEDMELSDEQLEIVAGGEVALVASIITAFIGSATLTFMIGSK